MSYDLVVKRGPVVTAGETFIADVAVAGRGGLAIVHAENLDIIQELRRRLAAGGKTGLRWHVPVCPSIAEGEAVHRALDLARLAGARLLGYHQSCQEGVSELRRAKANGQAAFGEVCIQYLVLTDEVYAGDDWRAQALMVSPPLREAALWEGLADGTLDIVSTDHNPRHRQPARDGQPAHHPPGTSSVETRRALLHTFGVKTGRLSLALTGFPVTTISRGEVIVADGRFVGRPGRGRFIERTY